MKQKRIMLAGGTGFLGNVLAQHLCERGFEVIVLTRNLPRGDGLARMLQWDGGTMGSWAHELEGSEAVINLAGRSVNCRYNGRNRKVILASRIDSTRVLGAAISQCKDPPPVWLNSSTATIYKHSFDYPMDEETGEIDATPEAKDEFSVEVARAWESCLEEADTPRTRKVALRTAMVLGTREGSVFRVLRRLVLAGLGGHMASGRQFVSWIHEKDFCRAVDWILARPDLSGPVNLTAPNPVSNGEMMRILREACGMRFGLPASRWMLEVGAALLRTETELTVKSRYVVPKRLLLSGFEFRFPYLHGAVEELCERLSRSVL